MALILTGFPTPQNPGYRLSPSTTHTELPTEAHNERCDICHIHYYERCRHWHWCGGDHLREGTVRVQVEAGGRSQALSTLPIGTTIRLLYEAATCDICYRLERVRACAKCLRCGGCEAILNNSWACRRCGGVMQQLFPERGLKRKCGCNKHRGY